MKRILLLGLTLLAGSFASTSHANETCDWTGTWSSTYGNLKLVQIGNKVTGDYAAVGTLEGIGEDLHRAQSAAAREHDWFFVKSARDVYKKHGNCAAQPYTNRICEAIRRTGDYNGSFHPNREGHAAAGLVIGREMVAHFKNQSETKKYFE